MYKSSYQLYNENVFSYKKKKKEKAEFYLNISRIAKIITVIS